MRIFKNLLIAGFFALTMVSCLDSGDNESSTTITFSSKENFNYVYDVDKGIGEVLDGADYVVKYIWSSGKADVVVRDLELENGASKITFNISGLKFSATDDGSVVISSQTTLMDDDNKYEISQLTIRRVESYYYSPVTIVSFVLNNKYVVRTIMRNFTVYGNTTVSGPSMPGIAQKKPSYFFALAQNGTATMAISDLSLFDQTFTLMVLDKLNYTVDSSGMTFKTSDETSVKFSPDPIEPISISNFISTANFAYSTNVGFDANNDHVSASLGIFNTVKQ